MTEQEVRQFFRGLKANRQLRRDLISEQERATEDLCQIRAVDYEKPRVSGGSDTDISKMLAAAEEQNRERRRRLAALTLTIEEEAVKAYDMISCCDNAMQKSVMIGRWMREMRWETMENIHHYGRWMLWKYEAAAIAAIARNYGKPRKTPAAKKAKAKAESPWEETGLFPADES